MYTAGPKRIVCLTEDSTEILCDLGEEERIVGISAYAVRPAGIESRKPVVSAYVDGSVRKICELKPDLILGFSDVQADLAGKLIKAQQQVLIFNQRSIKEILETVLTIGRLVGEPGRAQSLVDEYERRLDQARRVTALQTYAPRVYFEEWDEPAICGGQWISELISVAGGIDIFEDRAHAKASVGRGVELSEVIDRNPELMVASWCGKKLDRKAVLGREGFQALSAIDNGHLYEMDPSIILQPGPAALTEGLEALEELIRPLASPI